MTGIFIRRQQLSAVSKDFVVVIPLACYLPVKFFGLRFCHLKFDGYVVGLFVLSLVISYRYY